MATPTNYRGEDLRGQSFRALDLTGADFSDADVRGADFSDASLVGANFAHARIGAPPRAGAIIIGVAMLVAVVAGLAIGWAGSEVRDRLTSAEWQDQLVGMTVLVISLVFLGLLIVKGTGWALRAFALALVLGAAIDLVIVLRFGEIRVGVLFQALVILVLISLATLVGIVGRIVGGVFGGYAVVVIAVVGGYATGRASGGVGTLLVGIVLAVIAKRALKADIRDRPVRRLAYRLMARFGTRFVGANVSNTDFTGTLLGQADASDVVLSKVWWAADSPPTISSAGDDGPTERTGGPP